jgi:eukaryotic-like serine/threonine-protein kinase
VNQDALSQDPVNREQAGRFTLHRKLAAGGMGRVFEAEDPLGPRRVALKLIDLGTDPDSLQIVSAERLGAELQTRLCAIDKRVTAIFESGEMPRYFYIVMEYVDGRDLSELYAAKPLEPMLAARITQDVVEVLDRAHNFSTTLDGRSIRGVVHGDLKPRNIRLTAAGEVKILDFGIAKALSLTRSFTHNVFGSVQYSSPQRLLTGEVDAGADLWAAGVMLYEMLAGHPYFQAENGSRLEHLIRSYDCVLPLPETLPLALRNILRRALHPDLRVRYQTAAQFATDLQAFRNGQAVSAPEDGEGTRRVPRNDDATKRTSRPVAAPQAPPVAAIPRTTATPWAPVLVHPAARRRPSFARTVLRTIAVLFLVVMLFPVYLLVNEYLVWGSAHQLARDLSSEKQQNLDAAWRQYQKLSSRSHFPVSLWAARSELQKHLVADADSTIVKFGAPDAPPVSESDWTHARDDLSRAIELDPGDKTLHGKIRLVDGHLARLRGNAEQDPRLIEDARQDFQAASLSLKRSPDPWLGLAPLYIYSLHDLTHGEAAIRQADHLGHANGKRETAELADICHFRAQRTITLGDHASTRSEALRYYRLAAPDLARARRLYESILPWDGIAASLQQVTDSMNHISTMK